MDWRRSAIEAAAKYLRGLIDAGLADERTTEVYNGLVDLLVPTRSATRIQRAVSADAALALAHVGLDRRGVLPRRRRPDRRLVDVGTLDSERRGQVRRLTVDRRSRD